MPLQIQRTATVYRLWDEADAKAVCEDHAREGWLAEWKCIRQDGGLLLWVLSLQKTATKQLVSAPESHVIVSDFATVVAQTVEEYNDANLDNMIEVDS